MERWWLRRTYSCRDKGKEAGVSGAEMCTRTSEAMGMGQGSRKVAGGRGLISVIKDELSRGR